MTQMNHRPPLRPARKLFGPRDAAAWQDTVSGQAEAAPQPAAKSDPPPEWVDTVPLGLPPGTRPADR